MGNYIVGITGASGAIYGKHLITRLLARGLGVHLCMTGAARLVTRAELGWEANRLKESGEAQTYLRELFQTGDALRCYDIDAVGADIASGSFGADGMIIVPCSMGTLSAVAHGGSRNLLERAADVCLKERRPLVVVPREAPYSQIHLENMLALSRYGAVIMPASPAFYGGPETIEALVDFFVARLLDQLGLRDAAAGRWSGIE